MKKYLARDAQGKLVTFLASGFEPENAKLIPDYAEAEDYAVSVDERLIFNAQNLPAREKTSVYFHEVMKLSSESYWRSGMQPVIIREDGKLKVIMLGVGVGDSRVLMLAPSGFEPGDEKYMKEVKDGIEIDFGAKERDLKKSYPEPKKLQEKNDWNAMGIGERVKKSFWK